MKRRAWWFLWLMPLFVAAGPLYMYWLENPPVTPAEQELQAIARQTSEVRMVSDECGDDDCPVIARLRDVEIEKLLDVMRISNNGLSFNAGAVDMQSVRLDFYAQQKLITHIHYLPRFDGGAYLRSNGSADVMWTHHGYYLRPHFKARFDAFIRAKMRR